MFKRNYSVYCGTFIKQLIKKNCQPFQNDGAQIISLMVKSIQYKQQQKVAKQQHN